MRLGISGLLGGLFIFFKQLFEGALVDAVDLRLDKVYFVGELNTVTEKTSADLEVKVLDTVAEKR